MRMSVIARTKAVPSDRPAGGEFDTALNGEEKSVLSRAMSALVQGDSRGFCDILWLGLGDRWGELLAALAESRHVRITDGEAADGILITERGRALASDLDSRLRESA